MTALRSVYHLARADFLERVRRYSFLVTMIACVCLAYAFVPPNPGKYVTLKIETYRGIYNSAWVGASLALLSGTFLSVVGFFVVKNAVDRDRQTRVGQIIAATPVSKLQYTLGKTLSNFAVLTAMTLVVATAAIGMQWIRAEDHTINLWQIYSPFILLTLPVLMLTAALAVLFETIPGLRGGGGNVLFVFAWIGMLSSGVASHLGGLAPVNDVLGTGIAWPGMVQEAARAYPTFDPAHPSMSMGINIRNDSLWTLETYRWDGIRWNATMLGWRGMWLLAGLMLGAVAAIPFDRFDPARVLARAPRRRRKRSRAATDTPAGETPAVSATHVHLTPLARTARAARPGAMVIAEWRLIARGKRMWYIGPLTVAVLSAFLPLHALRFPVLPIAFLWPVLRWSQLGSRERRNGTEPILFSSPHPLARQLPAAWVAGMGLGVLMTLPVAARMLIAGETGALFLWLAGVAFAPALAMTLGVWTGSSKFFEATYAFLWYAMLQRVPLFDFCGCLDEGVRNGNAAWYAALTLILLALALLGRSRRLQA